MKYNISFTGVPKELVPAMATKVAEVLEKNGFVNAKSLAPNASHCTGNESFCFVIGYGYPEPIKYLTWNRKPYSPSEFPILEVLKDWEVISKLTPTPTVVLNSEYSAVVHPDHVQVGCQKISFDKIRELYKLLPPE